MKILHISTYYNEGGAGVAAYRIHNRLLNNNIESFLLVNSILSPSEKNIIYPKKLVEKTLAVIKEYFDSLVARIDNSTGTDHRSYNIFPDFLSKTIKRINPDIIHVHWLGNGFINPETISKLSIPIVWTLHDFWPLTGTSHLNTSEKRKLSVLGKILNKSLYQRKKNLFSGANITYIAPSRWVYNQALKITNHAINIRLIRNSVDTNSFRPCNKSLARRRLNLPTNKSILLFVARNILDDHNKGFIKLIKSLAMLDGKTKEDTVLVIVGDENDNSEYENYAGIEIVSMGVLSNEKNMISIYQAADLTLVPSSIETLSYVAMESMACGTPCITTAKGGITELVINDVNGMVISSNKTSEFAHTIRDLLNSRRRLKRYSLNSRNHIKNNYSNSMLLREHKKLYRELLKNS